MNKLSDRMKVVNLQLICIVVAMVIIIAVMVWKAERARRCREDCLKNKLSAESCRHLCRSSR